MDRQAYWILKEIPELDHTDDKYKGKDVVVEDARLEICFKTGMSGFHITLFFFWLNKMIMESGAGDKNMDKLCEQLDGLYGCLPPKDENLFQKKCFEIQQVKSFNQYYPQMGIPCPDAEALRLRLKQAIDNSRAKGYHGNDLNMNVIPELSV